MRALFSAGGFLATLYYWWPLPAMDPNSWPALLGVAYGAICFCLILLSAPRKENRTVVFSLLFLQVMNAGVLFLGDLRLVGLCWLLGLFPAAVSRSGNRWQWLARNRLYLYYQVLGAFSLLAALYFLGSLHAEWFLITRLPLLAAPGGSTAILAGTCVLFSVWVRLGLFPFHAGSLSLLKDSPLPLGIGLLTAPGAFALFLRVALPLCPLTETSLTLVRALVISSLYLAFLGVVQKSPRKWLGLLYPILISAATLGWAMPSHLGVMGSVYLWVTAMLSTTGLGIVLWLVEERTGLERWSEGGGWVRVMPGIAAFFFIFGLSAVNVPGTFGFLGEDLVLQATFATEPLTAALSVIAMGLLAVTMYRGYLLLFLGKVNAEMPACDLLPRERWSLLLLLLLLVGFGLSF